MLARVRDLLKQFAIIGVHTHGKIARNMNRLIALPATKVARLSYIRSGTAIPSVASAAVNRRRAIFAATINTARLV